MPKRGGNKGGFRGQWGSNDNQRNYNKNYNEHDDRKDDVPRKRGGGNIKRRVSFKPTHGGNRNLDLAIKAHLGEDTDMGCGGEQSHGGYENRGNFRGGRGRGIRRHSPPPRSNHNVRKLLQCSGGWYMVTVPHGHKYDKEYILKMLERFLQPDPFLPFYYQVEDNSIFFYVDEFKTAEKLSNADRKLQMPDGFKMILKVRSSIPACKVDPYVKERMKMAMVKRYIAGTKALDLTRFHADPDLQDVFCGLSRPPLMLLAIDVISENIPELEALNLSNNKIHLLDHLSQMSSKLQNLKILHLKNNRINAAASLDAFKGLPLVDLVLEGNPIKDRIKDQTAYVSEIRKRLPKLLKLDGMDLPPTIGFDVSDEIALPTPKASYLCDTAGAEIVRQFLEQYFLIYDSDNRQPLLDAYHEHAQFSMTATYNSTNRLTAYLSHNRNITRVHDLEIRCRHLKMGRLPVVSFLSELPPSQHDPQSFAVDLTLFTPQLILLTVTGIFKEKSSNPNLLRSFQRSLVIVPAGSGFCIRNDMLHINNVTQQQEKKAFKMPVVQQQQQQQIQHPQPTMVPSTSGPDEHTKLQMVQLMSRNSNMNMEWSKKCLEETNWDFTRAEYIFSELHKQNKIPPEAFVKY